MIEVTVKDIIGRFKQSHKVTAQTTLKVLRTKITIPKEQDSFTFVNKESISIGLESEQEELVTNYAGNNNQLTIKFTTKQEEQSKKGKEFHQKNQGELEKSMKTKTIVEGWIKDLENFEKKTDLEAKEKQRLLEEKLKKLESQLRKRIDKFSLQSQTKLQDVVKTLKEIVEEKEQYIKILLQSKFLSLSELAGLFSNQICNGYLKGQKRSIQIIDVQKSEIFIDAGYNQMYLQQFSYQSQNIERKHSAMIQKQCTAGSLSMMGGSPFFFLQGNASYDSAWQRKEQSTNETKYTSYVKTIFASYIGNGIKFTSDSIQITDNFRQSVKRIYQAYKHQQKGSSRPSQQFLNQAKKFFQDYGQYVETGTYYLGRTYFNKVSCTFKKEQDLQSTKTMSSTALTVCVAGGGIFSGGFLAAKGSLSLNRDKAFIETIQKLSSQMSINSFHVSHPPILDIKKWREVISTTNSYWKILQKNVEQTTSIFKILRNNLNMKVLMIQPEEIEKFGQYMKQCLDIIQFQQRNVIQLSVKNFSLIPKEVERLKQSKKEIKILRIILDNEQCINPIIQSTQHDFNPAYKQFYAAVNGPLFSVRIHSFSRKAETIQTVISVIKQIVLFLLLKGKHSSILDGTNDFIQLVNFLSTLECTYLWIFSWKTVVPELKLQAIGRVKTLCKVEQYLFSIPVINSSAMRRFGRSLRLLPGLKLRIFVGKRYQDLQTTPNWTEETVQNVVVTYE